MRYFIFFIFFISLNGCNKKAKPLDIKNRTFVEKKNKIPEDIFKIWYKQDVILDSIPGISLNRAHEFLLKNIVDSEVIVAVIDTEIDINHERLIKKTCVNTDEIPFNNIDDDKNCYIDDINGWNFIGNLNGDNIIYSNIEAVRIIQKYDSLFKNKEIKNISKNDLDKYHLYKSANKEYKEKFKKAIDNQEYGNFLYLGYPKAKNAVKKIFPNEEYSVKDLDSVYKKYKDSNKKLAENAYFISDFIKYNLSEEWIKNYKEGADNLINTIYNLNFFDRRKIDKNPEDINYSNYGNPYVNKNLDKFYHGTLVAGLIVNENDSKIKIIPLAISSNGEENDKDIALAIKYAVNNGAKVINLSFGKTLSMHQNWVSDAIKYAESRNVLIISSAGNSSRDFNDGYKYFPNDNEFENGKTEEITDNFLLVGASSYKTDKSIFPKFTNYGNYQVDVFTPGEKIYTSLLKIGISMIVEPLFHQQ